MAVLPGLKEGFYIKMSPKAHKLEDITTKSHGKLVLAKRPKDYPKTSQQKKVAAAAKACGIKSGISRAALVTAMKDCIPKEFGKAT